MMHFIQCSRLVFVKKSRIFRQLRFIKWREKSNLNWVQKFCRMNTFLKRGDKTEIDFPAQFNYCFFFSKTALHKNQKSYRATNQ